jgi:hypothetical protein
MSDTIENRVSERPLPTAPLPSATDSPPPRSKSGMGWIVATVLFVAIVAAIAWVSQNLPKGKRNVIVGPVTIRGPDLDFVVAQAVWEQPDTHYAKEYEQGVEGHYDFPFRNSHDYPVTVGFMRTSCDCTGLKGTPLSTDQVAALPTTPAQMPMAELPGIAWTEMPKDERTGIQVPAHGGGVIRMFWNGRKKPGEFLKLNVSLWTAPSDRLDDRTDQGLQAPILMTTPIRFDPPKLGLGTLSTNGMAEGTVIIHSATRDKLPLVVDRSQLDELFDVRLEEMKPDELKAYEKQLRAQKYDTRLRSATKALVTLREQGGGKQLDQGYFSRQLPVRLGDEPEFDTPVVTAVTRGDIEIGVGEEMGKVVFRPFLTREGSVKRMPLWIESPADLVVEKTTPAFLAVKLTRDKKNSDAVRKKWNLEVSLPPGSLAGTLSEDAVIILRTDTASPRRVRIPVVATATGGQG